MTACLLASSENGDWVHVNIKISKWKKECTCEAQRKEKTADSWELVKPLFTVQIFLNQLKVKV